MHTASTMHSKQQYYPAALFSPLKLRWLAVPPTHLEIPASLTQSLQVLDQVHTTHNQVELDTLQVDQSCQVRHTAQIAPQPHPEPWSVAIITHTHTVYWLSVLVDIVAMLRWLHDRSKCHDATHVQNEPCCCLKPYIYSGTVQSVGLGQGVFGSGRQHNVDRECVRCNIT